MRPGPSRVEPCQEQGIRFTVELRCKQKKRAGFSELETALENCRQSVDQVGHEIPWNGDKYDHRESVPISDANRDTDFAGSRVDRKILCRRKLEWTGIEVERYQRCHGHLGNGVRQSCNSLGVPVIVRLL